MSDRLPAVAFPGAAAGLPAQEAVEFADAYLVGVQVDVTGGAAHFCWRRYNYAENRLITELEAKIIGVEPETVTHVPELWAEAAQYPLVAQVVGGLLVVADKTKQLLAARIVVASTATVLQDRLNEEAAAQRSLVAAEQAATEAQAAITALPPEATEEERAAAQQAFDAATADVAAKSQALAALAPGVEAAQAASDQAAQAVTAIEAALGKA